ncbi:bifunctional 4-hydroxy-2-oxoglutarate aldolase/2-dehydro-3-deoxy-phosphogluconate aldolase [Castellaniella caeni]|uniref:bifunctional 4-hydroxy-2-oxoglutarate aldolase/2-dehydro-3-deoxy-phosphogluconate aldolase n=1 Tax=Castellaniella caeni TaxID=266123 RepID=UPI000C9F9612|nr:bifunctional 4-hydroxy-2-oxoglutarate aldolase/2-dehydro-3-deoxy-phosphogluconate aldolase [Castellaniella caeni]
MNAQDLLAHSPVMPVIVIQDTASAVGLARALVAGGILSIEVTLRSPAALDAIRAIRDQVPDALVGAGTIRTPQQLDDVLRAGARFGVSPGLTPALARAARSADIPFLPGVSTTSEAMQAAEWGFTAQKLFPAEAIGGVALLKAWHGPLPDLRFCPTGGIHARNAGGYLALPNVGCVGGSWLTPAPAVINHDWDAITQLARQARTLATCPQN